MLVDYVRVYEKAEPPKKSLPNPRRLQCGPTPDSDGVGIRRPLSISWNIVF